MLHELLQTNLSLDEAERLQEKYHREIKNHNNNIIKSIDIKKINWIVGVDVSYYNDNLKEWGIAVAVLWNLHSRKMECHSVAKEIVIFPYKPGFLGFRECNLMVKAINNLPKTPNIIMCDGHGRIHPKRFGEAVHLGVVLNIPTIGVAKNPFIGFSEWKTLERKQGNKTPIWAINPKNSMRVNNEHLGYALCLNHGMKPIFVSVGYKITLDIAVEIVLRTTINHKQPEPLFLADYLSRNEI